MAKHRKTNKENKVVQNIKWELKLSNIEISLLLFKFRNIQQRSDWWFQTWERVTVESKLLANFIFFVTDAGRVARKLHTNNYHLHAWFYFTPSDSKFAISKNRISLAVKLHQKWSRWALQRHYSFVLHGIECNFCVLKRSNKFVLFVFGCLSIWNKIQHFFQKLL